MPAKALRILYVSHSFPLPDRPLSNVGGMQRVAVGLHRALAARSDVELRTVVLETSWGSTGIRTPAFLLKLVRSLPRLAREHRADVVLFSSMVTASVTLVIGDRLRQAGALTAVIPVGRDVTLPNAAYQRLVPRIFRAIDLVLPISRATADTCRVRGAVEKAVHVVPCGIDLPTALSAAERKKKRIALLEALIEQGYALPDESLLLLSVGRHQERKGFHWFVDEVMPHLPEDVVYLLAGSGPMTSTIMERAARRGLQKRVVMLGQVSEEMLELLYAGSDLFVMPNVPVPGDIEGFGVVMLEAGAAGLPVVAADLEGIRDVIRDGQNGLLIPTGDADGFRDAVQSFRNAEERQGAAERASDYVRSTFGWQGVAEQHVAILRRQLGRSPQPL